MYWFPGGISEWRSFNYPLVVGNTFKGIKVNKLTPSEVKKYVSEGDVLVVDVRPQNLQKYPNFIAGAKNYPLLTLVEDSIMLPKNQPIILTDGTMRQSPLAAKYLSSKGFNIIGILKGGLVRWEYEGFPVEKRDFVKTKLD